MTQTLILVTILLITQVTELKLLFETQVSQHRFYYVIMASLITCIAIEILIGLITVYVTQKRSDFWSRMTSDAKTKNPDQKSAIYAGCHGKNSSASNVRNIFSISGTCSYTSLNRPSQYLGQVTQVVTSQIRPNLPFIDSPGTSCSSASQKLATIPEDSPNSSATKAAEEEMIRVKIEDNSNNDDDETDFIHYSSSGCNCCMHRRHPCDKDLMKSWHNVHFYLLYLIMVLNVFITAFGLSGENLRLQIE